MLTGLANVSLNARDYDQAIEWFAEDPGLELRVDGFESREAPQGVHVVSEDLYGNSHVVLETSPRTLR